MAFELLGVDAVDWSSMRVGSGSPLEIPHLLQRISNPTDEHDLHLAVGRLHSIVIHEHSVSVVECSEHVIPFLIALCRCPRRSVAAHALQLMTELADCDPFWVEAEHGNHGLAARVGAALRAGLPEYGNLLLNDDPLARQAVLVLLFRLEYAPEWLHRTVTDVLAVDDQRGVLDLARALLINPAYHYEGFELIEAALAKRR
ncbi:hypothetical protein AB0J90_29840 [Micromonospora sp. NPDC049523]|uniref:hypothetical protein n=1 Tax=Micromonospora sp. NPDC049523 TaxID=3155921 RepID=UPI00342C5B15